MSGRGKSTWDPITIDGARLILRALDDLDRDPTWQDIIRTSADVFGVFPTQITMKSGHAYPYVRARHVAMVLVRRLCPTGRTSFAWVGHKFNRDHSTVINACKRIGHMIDAAQETHMGSAPQASRHAAASAAHAGL